MTEAPDLDAAIRRALAADPARLLRLCHRGRTVWIKRAESLPLLRRLQKGSPVAALERERAALHLWRQHGAPAPEILAEGPDFIAMSDCGVPLSRLLTGAVPCGRPLTEVFSNAGRALADLHALGLSHGRPSLRDILWDGTRITFVDLERASPQRDTLHGHAMDLVMFVFNGLVVGGGAMPEVDAAIAAYRDRDPGAVWQAAQDWCRRMRWIGPATAPIRWRGPGKANEFKAIPKTLDTFLQS